MAKFELREGEEVISHYDVLLVDGAETTRSRLLMTNHRLVVIAGRKASFVETMFGLLGTVGARLLALNEGTRITYEIARERFASVDPGEGKVIVFHDDGDGYAHTSFAIVRDILTNNDDAVAWQQRMHTWASHSPPAAPLPAATLHSSRK